MIEIENALYQKEGTTGGLIRVVDFLKNGNKNILMSNGELNAYVDHNNGGHVFELDFKPRHVNLCAGYCSATHEPPRIISPGKSRTAFVDHILPELASFGDFVEGRAQELGNFVSGKFEYKIKKIGAGVRTLLSKQGVVVQEGRACPLAMEKVLGLEKDKGVLSFVYQLSNHSFTPYAFRFAIELTLTLPGAATQSAFIYAGKGKRVRRSCTENVTFDSVTDWEIVDPVSAVRLKFVTQKPVDIWLYSAEPQYQGTTFVLSTAVRMEGSTVWTLMGKMVCRNLRQRSRDSHEI
jgi:hypothetical protein